VTRTLNTLDLLVCAGYFVAVVAVGFLSSRRQRHTVDGYFRGDNRLPWYAIGFSIVAAGISSEQFVGEMGYAYKLGLPVANWEWLVLPGLSALLWIFVPLYVRGRVATMPEYLERRFGPQTRTLYAALTVASYVLVNFALVFYTGGFALEKLWGIDRVWAVWFLALVTGAYTVYGGLTAMAWTSSFQCVLLLGGGLYLCVAGLARIGWDFTALLGAGQRAHLFTPADHEVPWTAMVVLMLSTNVWYYATNQYINQRCLAARDEWHAKMGVLFSVALQLLVPLGTCVPGLIYRVINPNLDNPDATYPMLVAEVVPPGLRGLVIAAVLGAIMSTVSGLVNSTATLVTLDLIRPGIGKAWDDRRLVRVGGWSGALALLVGAALAPIVMKWQNIFRYAQDIWAPMAAPVVVVFLAAALWERATDKGARACLWLSILSVPLVLIKGVLADAGVHFLPTNLENPMVFAGALGLVAMIAMATLSWPGGGWHRWLGTAVAVGGIGWLATVSPVATALVLMGTSAGCLLLLLVRRREVAANLWDHSMVRDDRRRPWYAGLWLWWSVLAGILVVLYALLW
jgi:SSS family solute:Na+ symporter